MRLRLLVAAAAVELMLSACAGMQPHELVRDVPKGEMDDFLADKAPETKRLYARVLMEGKRNEVLNHMRAGLAAMEVSDHDNAVRSFDIALTTIETIYADNPTAAQARSVWTKENVKDFKGEPYERALAYYYRGLLYMQDGDYENARASFKGGILQSAMSYNERFDADFPLLDFLEGWAGRCAGAGSITKDSFDAAAKSNPALAEPPAGQSVLLLAELGNPPRKVAKGNNKELLAFQPGPAAPEAGVVFLAKLKGALPASGKLPSWTAPQGADLFYQASTRGGRPIDGILEGKARMKDTTKVVSAVAVGTGGALMHSTDKNAQTAGAVIALAGLIGTVAASAMRPEADVRSWDNIPGQIDLVTLRAEDVALAKTANAKKTLAAKDALALVEAAFLDGQGVEVARKPVMLTTAGRCSLGWVRARSALAVPDSAPGAIARP